MTFVDLDLASHLEGFEARFAADCGRALREVRPGGDVVTLAVGGGFALYLGEGSPLNEAKGLGMAGPVCLGDLETMGRVFFDRGVAAKVVVCPMADPSLLDGLGRLGYRASGFEDVLYRALDPSEAFPGPPEGVTVAWAEPIEAEVCGMTLARGFTAPEEPGPAIGDVVACAIRCEGLTSLLARVDGEPAGAASLLIREGLAMLAGAATLPAFRNRGIQTGLAHARLARAGESGSELVVMGAEPGTTSHRNAERLGFRVAYSRLILLCEPDAPGRRI